MNVYAIVVLAILTIIFTIGIFQEAFAFDFETFDQFTWACNGSEVYMNCFRVYYASMSHQEMIDYCGLGEKILGCHKTHYFIDSFPIHTIALEKGNEHAKTHSGCSIWTHEILHAWGYHEQMIDQFFPCNETSMFVNATLPHTGFWK